MKQRVIIDIHKRPHLMSRRSIEIDSESGNYYEEDCMYELEKHYVGARLPNCIETNENKGINDHYGRPTLCYEYTDHGRFMVFEKWMVEDVWNGIEYIPTVEEIIDGWL